MPIWVLVTTEYKHHAVGIPMKLDNSRMGLIPTRSDKRPANGDNTIVKLEQNTTHYLRRTDVEQLVRQGYLEQTS